MHVSIQLFLYCFNYFWMPMSDIGNTDTTDKINVFFSIYIK